MEKDSYCILYLQGNEAAGLRTNSPSHQLAILFKPVARDQYCFIWGLAQSTTGFDLEILSHKSRQSIYKK